VLPDILTLGLDLVVCGTAAGTRSAQVGHYYAAPGNIFWRTLFEVGLTPRQLVPSEAHLLLDYGIGLTDVAKGQSGADSEIDFNRIDRELFEGKIRRLRPRLLCFNGKRAAQEYFRSRSVSYGLQQKGIGTTALCVAPSTSAAANRSWDLTQWRHLAELVRG
jgi:double-stranded uracil-DNA glycosylase